MTNKLEYIFFFCLKKKMNGDDVSKKNLLCELGIKCLRTKKRMCVSRIDIKIQANSNQVRRIGLNVIAILRVYVYGAMFSFLIYFICSFSHIRLTLCLWLWIEQWLCVCCSNRMQIQRDYYFFFMLNSIGHKSALKWI